VNNRVIDVDRWEDAVAEIEKIKAANASNNPIWFRGQSKACWGLTTTLERFQKQDDTNFVSYYRHVVFIKPEIEAVTGLSWVLNVGQLIKWAKDKQTSERLLARDYLAYLRHNGFPSPLLDWSHSRYVAAYFAFAGSEGRPSDRVALFVYLETSQSVKVDLDSHPNIQTIDHHVKTHTRHFRQQSRYTICCEFREPTGWWFTSHERVFALSQLGGSQDLLWKITIPASERTKVLSYLDEFNLNAFSLFGSDESLMETLAFRQLGSGREIVNPPIRLIAIDDAPTEVK
jgi:hypothetical protein